jgi:fibronectin type 3 domain-containing protein
MSGTGVAAAAHSVDLKWSASASNVAGYHVYRGLTTGGPYTLLSAALDTTASYHDGTVLGGNRYYYVVTAIDTSNLESGFSNEVAVTIPTP